MFYKECEKDLELLDSFNKKLAMLPDWILTGFITTEITIKIHLHRNCDFRKVDRVSP